MTAAMPAPAAGLVKRYLRSVARRLGVANPVPILGDETFDRAYAAPAGDPYHGQNGLVPHYLPLEISFRESRAAGLRFALELMGPGALPSVRRDATTSLFRQLVEERLGAGLLEWFDEHGQPWRDERLEDTTARGAFLGALIGRQGLRAAKIYYRLGREQLPCLPPGLRVAVETALALVPARPRGVAFTCGRGAGAIQTYLLLSEDLGLEQLAALMRALGLGRAVAALLPAVAAVSAGGSALPAESVYLELRERPPGLELQLDLMMGGCERPPARLGELIGRLLSDRPGAGAAWHRWLDAVGLSRRPAGNVTSLALRVDGASPPALSVYLVPAMARLRPPRLASDTSPAGALADEAEPQAAPDRLPEL